MKRVLFVVAVLAVAHMVFAGGLVTNTNQSAQFVRSLSRNASTQVDAIYFNPAGVTQLEDDVQRPVELAGLTPQDIRELAKEKLSPTAAKFLLKFIKNHKNIAALCSVPANIIGLIDFLAWRTKGGYKIEAFQVLKTPVSSSLYGQLSKRQLLQPSE